MRIPIILFILSMAAFTANAQQGAESKESKEAAEANARLKQKIKMVDFILRSPDMQRRRQASDDKLAKDLLARATNNFMEMDEYFDRGEYLEAEAILDFVLRDLSVASQLLSADSRKQDRYKQSLRQLDSFELPTWKNLTFEQSEYLQTQLMQIEALREKSVQLSSDRDFDAAVELLDRAYNLKRELIVELPHEQVVVYDQVFDSIHEEYEYLNRRSYHYLEMVELALTRVETNLPTRKLVDDYIYRALGDLEEAEKLEDQDRLADAIGKLDQTIKQLVSALKILGINI